MTNKVPSGMIKHRQSMELEIDKCPSSDRLASLWIYHDGFHTKQQHLLWAVHNPPLSRLQSCT